MTADLDKLFEEISIYRQREDDIAKEEFSDPYSDVWNFSVLLHIIPPYGPGTPDCGRLNLEAIPIIRKNIERIIPMMTCFERVSSIISFNETSQTEKMGEILKKMAQSKVDFFCHVMPTFHTYIFSFNENFITVGNQLEFVNLLTKATYGALIYLDLIFNKGDIDLYHQCAYTHRANYSSINTLLTRTSSNTGTPNLGILNFIKKVRLYGTHHI